MTTHANGTARNDQPVVPDRAPDLSSFAFSGELQAPIPPRPLHRTDDSPSKTNPFVRPPAQETEVPMQRQPPDAPDEESTPAHTKPAKRRMPWAKKAPPTDPQPALFEKLWEIGNGNHLTATLLGGTGGCGKTTVTAYLASMLSDVTRQVTLVVDANNNGGNVCKLLDVDRRSTPQLNDAIADQDPGCTFRGSVGAMPSSKSHGVKVLASDSDDQTPSEDYTPLEYHSIFRLARNNASNLLIDTAPTMWSNAATAAIPQSDVLLFVANAQDRKSLDGCKATLTKYRKDGHGPILDTRSIIVLHGADDTQIEAIMRELEHTGPVVNIPYDSYIARDAPANLTAVDNHTLTRLLELAILCYKQAETNPNRVTG